MPIHYLTQQQIDKKKWDACINMASNGLIYARSYYLDITANNWDALVLNDYEAVMPLPSRKKWGFTYLFQPAMTPILGIFGNDITTEMVHLFLQAVPAGFALWDLSLNHFNPILPGTYPTYARANFVLSLHNTYKNIQLNYHENTRRNINKALKLECKINKNIPVDEVIEICKKAFPQFTTVKKGLFEGLKKIYHHPDHLSATYGVVNKSGQLLASAAFLFFNKRAYYWLAGNEPESRKYGASSLLLDALIRDHAQQSLLLDFEGSDNPGVAGFYKKMGAMPEPFNAVFYNKLPFPFHYFKKVPKQYLRSGLQPD